MFWLISVLQDMFLNLQVFAFEGQNIACVASVSVKQRAKKKRRTGVSAFCPRENGARAKIRRRGWRRGRKEGNSVSFAPLPHPPPSYFCSRPIFHAGETLKTRVFALFSTETLAMQARQNMTCPVNLLLSCILNSLLSNCLCVKAW